MYLRTYFRRKALFIFFSIIFLGISGGIVFTEFNFFNKAVPAQATFYDAATGTGDNCRGFAWSPNFGWISFNSSDCDLNGDGDFGDVGAPAGCPGVGVNFHDYGVNIETGTGIFSGFAWSQNLGWIYFGPDANLSGFGDVLEADAPVDPKQWATYDFDTNQISGWARALSLGVDGWISLSGTWASGVEIDPATYDFSGFAWNGNDTGDGIGWISFNCLDMPRTCSGGSNPGTPCPVGNECLGGGVCSDTCSLTDYKVTGVTNQPPVAKNLQAPFLSNDQLCELGVRSAILKWEFDDSDNGSFETAYQIIFDDDDDPNDPLLATPKCPFNSTHVDCLVAPGVDQYPIHESGIISLEFGKHYYWWVKVWDNIDTSSDWVASTDGWGADFIVPGHEYPDVSIEDYWPDNPSVGESVFFEASSAIYEYGDPSLSIPCENDGLNCFWEWSVSPDDHATISNADGVEPEVVFDSSAVDVYYVTLKVTDKDGFYCTDIQELKAKYKLPKWIEVKGDGN